MSSDSSPPVLQGRNIRPRARDSSIEFWWGYPSADDGAVISSYTLFCASPSISQSVGPSTFYTNVSSLTNGTEYAFQIVANDSSSATTAPAVYRTVTPGFKATEALSTSVVVTGAGQVAVSWQPPASDGSAPIGWYVVRSVSSSPSDPVIKLSAYPTDSTKTISGLNTASLYSFNVYAVNDPGYSPPASTLTVSPNLGDRFTYIELYHPDGGSNYAYRIYKSQTDTWAVVSSFYSVNDYDGQYTSSNFEENDDYNGTSTTFSTGYRSRYSHPDIGYDEYRFEFRQNDGSLIRTISTYTNNDDFYLPGAHGNSNTGFFYNSNDSTGNYDIQIYQPHTNTYQSASITNTNNYMRDVELLNNGVYFVTSNVDHYEHYIWNINSNVPTLITSNYNYNYENLFSPSTAMFVIGQTSNPPYYDTVTYMDDTTFSANYVLPADTYTNSRTGQYGVLGNRTYFRGYNETTSNYDLYVFNQMPNMTPVVLSNIHSNGYSYNDLYEGNYTGGESYYQTRNTSDVLFILNTQATTNYIREGGGSVVYDYEKLFYNAGNYINMKITLEDNSTPVNNSYMYYGTALQRSNFGYVVGSVGAYPHTSFTYTTAGSNEIYVHGEYKIIYSNVDVYSTFTGSYTCTNGNQGTYWVRQTGASVPSTDPEPFGVDLWYTVTNSNWGSDVQFGSPNYTNGGASYNYSNTVYGSNYIFCKSLIGSISSISGRWEGSFLDATTIEGFLSAYVNDAPFCDDPNNFSTINVKAFDDWNVSTGYVYYSTLLTTNFPYVYDGDMDYYSPHRKGAAYLISGSNTTVVSTIFTTSNLVAEYFTDINLNGAGFIVEEGNNVTAHILTSNGETSTILSTVGVFTLDYAGNSSSDNFLDLFYYNMNSSNNLSSFLFVVSTNGTLLTASEVGSNDTNTQFSGRNAFRYEYNTSNLNIIQNGILTSTINMPYGYDDIENSFPDFANGQLAITSFNEDSNTVIVTVTNDAISTFSTNFFTEYTNTFLTQSFLMMWQTNPWNGHPFRVLARDMNTGSEYGYSTTSFSYEDDDPTNQADSICFTVYDDDISARNYVVFNFSTTTFSMVSDLPGDYGEYQFTTSPYWSNWYS